MDVLRMRLPNEGFDIKKLTLKTKYLHFFKTSEIRVGKSLIFIIFAHFLTTYIR